jgi:RNA polymerase sigma-70 factor (ECF subfamily)
MSQFSTRSDLVLDLFEQYYERVYCFVRRSLPADQAEDVAQEVFIRLMEHKNLESLTLQVSYLLKIADNLIKRRYSRNRRFARYLESAGRRTELDLDGEDSSMIPVLGAEELEDAMGSLTCVERDAVRLIVCQGMSYEDAARSLGVSVSTINNWKYRGLQKLKVNASVAAGAECSGRHRGPEAASDRSDREQGSGTSPAPRVARQARVRTTGITRLDSRISGR